MRFILSVVLATALLGAMATADPHGQKGQQAAFRLEPRHNKYSNEGYSHHHKKVNHSHHRKSSSKKIQRRDLQVLFLAAAVPIPDGASIVAAAPQVNGTLAEANMGLHKKQKHNGKDHSHYKNRVNLSRHKKSSHGKKVNHSHHQHEKRAASPMALRRKKVNHSHHKKASSSCHKNEKRAASPMALHRKNKKVDHSHHKMASSSSSCDA